ncbi:MAG: hypothetical protein R2838_21395 [Caldilineaceae bacterium]
MGDELVKIEAAVGVDTANVVLHVGADQPGCSALTVMGAVTPNAAVLVSMSRPALAAQYAPTRATGWVAAPLLTLTMRP